MAQVVEREMVASAARVRPLISRRRAWSRLALLSLLGVVLGLIAGELVLRAGIALGTESLRRPRLYADSRADDAYWLLHHRWSEDKGGRRPRTRLPDIGAVHPRLGWAPRVTPENPLGIIRKTPYTPDYGGNVVLFFGDSFVGSPGPMEAKLPQQLDSMLPDYTVYNYGVGGYGVDQIFLRFQQAHPLFTRPVVLFGILTKDLDRSLLRIRSGPKPYFRLQEDRLVLEGVPVPADPRTFVDENAPGIRSYLLALLQRRWEIAKAGGKEPEVFYRRQDKMEVNRRILEEVVREARARRLSPIFVLFFDQQELRSVGWREEFLLEELERLQVQYVNLKQVLLAAAVNSGSTIEDYFRKTDGHLNPRGNQVVASALADFLHEDRGIARVKASKLRRHRTLSDVAAVAVCGGMEHHAWAGDDSLRASIAYRRCAVGGDCDASVVLVSASTAASQPAVACDDDTVLVAWADSRRGNPDIALRRSTDGGVTFDGLKFVSRSEADELAPALALSGPVALVAWVDRRRGDPHIALRRSEDAGTSWEQMRFFAKTAEPPAVAVRAAAAWIGWLTPGGRRLAIRRSDDSGRTFGPLELRGRTGDGPLDPGELR